MSTHISRRFLTLAIKAVMAAPKAAEIAKANGVDRFTTWAADIAQGAIVGAVSHLDPAEALWFTRYVGHADESGNIRRAETVPLNREACDRAYHNLRAS